MHQIQEVLSASAVSALGGLSQLLGQQAEVVLRRVQDVRVDPQALSRSFRIHIFARSFSAVQGLSKKGSNSSRSSSGSASTSGSQKLQSEVEVKDNKG